MHSSLQACQCWRTYNLAVSRLAGRMVGLWREGLTLRPSMAAQQKLKEDGDIYMHTYLKSQLNMTELAH